MKKAIRIKLTESEQLGKQLAKTLQGGEILALIGPLGAGKTTFTKSLAKHLGIKHKINSPTFTLLHRFPLKLHRRKLLLYHLDLYRTKNFREAKTLGLDEFWGQPDAITVIEWADKIKKHLPSKTQPIFFSH